MEVIASLRINYDNDPTASKLLLETIFKVIVKQMGEEFGIRNRTSIQFENWSGVVYYKTDLKTHKRFKKKIEDTFKPGWFIFEERM